MSLILTIDELYELPPPEWLIDETVPDNASGEGKTFTVLDMAMHVAYGRPWHGRDVKQGSVLYVCGEGLSGIKARVKVWQDYHEGIEKPPLYVTRSEIGFGSADQVEDLIDAIVAHDDVALVIVDTLHANFGGGNENSSDDMARFLMGLRKVQRTLDAAVIVVHHTGHDNLHRARGHSSLKAALDTEIQVARSMTDEKLIGVTVTKQRNAEKWDEPLGFRFNVEETGWLKPSGEPITSCVLLHDTEIPAMPTAGNRKGAGRNQEVARKVVADLSRKASQFGDNGTRFIASKDLDDALREQFKDRNAKYRMRKWLTDDSGLLNWSVGGFTVDEHRI